MNEADQLLFWLLDRLLLPKQAKKSVWLDIWCLAEFHNYEFICKVFGANLLWDHASLLGWTSKLYQAAPEKGSSVTQDLPDFLSILSYYLRYFIASYPLSAYCPFFQSILSIPAKKEIPPALMNNEQVRHRSEEIPRASKRLPLLVQGKGKFSVEKCRFHSWA